MSEKTQPIELIHTPCKNCVYALYNNVTQYGCSLNYIEVFKSKGIEVLEAYDEDKEFYIINNKKCIGFRTDSWFKDRKLDHLSTEEKIKRHYDQNYIRYLLWIDLANFQTQDDLDFIISELKNISPKPSQIIFIRYKGILQDIHDYDHIKQLMTDSDLNNVPWRIQTMLLANMSMEEKIHEGVINCKNRFFVMIKNRPEKLSKIISTANTMVSEDMDSFNLIANSDKSVVIFPVSTYKYCLYNSKIDLLKQDALYQIL